MTSQLHPKENRAISRKELEILKSLKTIKIPFTCDVLRMGEVFDLLLLDVLSQGALVSSNNIYTKTVIYVLLRNNSIFQLRTFDAAFCCRRIFRRKIANFAQTCLNSIVDLISYVSMQAVWGAILFCEVFQVIPK